MNLKTPFVVLAAAGLLAFGGAGGAVAGTLITSTQIKDETILSRDIRNGAITTADLATGGVTTSDIRDGQVTSGDIATGGVTSSDVKDGSVTLADLSPEVVAKINAATGKTWNVSSPGSDSGEVEIVGEEFNAGQKITLNSVSTTGLENCQLVNDSVFAAFMPNGSGGDLYALLEQPGDFYTAEADGTVRIRVRCSGTPVVPAFTASVNYSIS